MWPTFALAALAAIAILYMPGYLFWRAFKFDNLMALCTAPLVSIAVLGIMAIVFEKVGVPANAMTIGAAVLVFCGAVAALSLIGRRRRTTLSFPATFGDSAGRHNRNAKGANKN